MLRSSRGNKNQSVGVAKEGRAIVNNPAHNWNLWQATLSKWGKPETEKQPSQNKLSPFSTKVISPHCIYLLSDRVNLLWKTNQPQHL